MSESHGLRASSHRTEDWRQIDWRRVRRTVRRLQARIVKAIQDGRWNKVKALQRLLTHSFSGKALAVKRVTENHGKRTPGVDGVTWSTPHQKMTAIDSLRQRGYQAQPLRRVYIPKSMGKLRPLGITTMYDRAMQALYLLALEPIAETTGDECSYGFRPTRSAADAIERCFKLLSKRTSPQWILEGDIRSCFDWIRHDWLLAKVTMDRSILRTWLKAGFMENDFLRPTNDGTPQGGVISPTLANLALDGLHNMLRDTFPQRHSYKVNLARYADDFIITGSFERCWRTRFARSWNSSSQSADLSFPPIRRSSRISSRGSTSSDKTSVSTRASCSLSLPREASAPYFGRSEES